jgi:hypothetical protein
MPRTCSICPHPSRNEIDAALIGGEPYRSIAQRFATSPDAMWRHKSDHVPAHLSKAEQVRETTQADSLLAQLLKLNQETMAILKEARAGEDNELALKAIARAEKQIELQARLLGELQDTTMVNVLVLPDWQQIRAIILEALAAYPQARVAVAGALGRLTL